MPRDLADVLHYFLPELDADSQPEARTLSPSAPDRLNASHRSTGQSLGADALPMLGVPIGDSELVKAALTWNLAVETARLGGRAIVLAPASEAHGPLWPEAGVGPLGTETILCEARNLQQLTQTAADLAKSHAASAARGGAIFVGVPTRWLATQGPHADPIGRWLLLSSSNRNELAESFDLAEAVRRLNAEAEVGVTIHGVTSVQEARGAFEHLSRLCQTRLQLGLTSYGLLFDDLYVYRAIAAGRPIGLAHPQAPATRALMDVAGLIYENTRGVGSSAEFEWGLVPKRPELRRAVRDRLRSGDPSLRILAEDFLASESTIDLLAVGDQGELVSIRIGRPGEDAELLTRSLSDLTWLRPRTRNLQKLLPGLGIEASAHARSILLCPDFGAETRAAIENLASHSIQLMVYRCYRRHGQLGVILEPQEQATLSRHRAPDREDRPRRRSSSKLETAPKPSSSQGATVTDPIEPREAPDPLLDLAPSAGFRTGLADADLRLETEENHRLEQPTQRRPHPS